jgi:hypothetical protein
VRRGRGRVVQRAVELVHGGHGWRTRHIHALRQGAHISAIGPIVDQELLQQRCVGHVAVGLHRLRLLLGHALLPREVEALTRDLGKRLQGRQLLRGRKRQAHGRAALHLRGAVSRGGVRHVVGEGQLVELQQRALAVAEGQRWAFLHQVVREAVDAALRELRCCQPSAF